MKLLVAAAAGLVVWLLPGPTSAQAIADDITVVVDPVARSVTLGEHLDITVTVSNTSATPSVALVAHIDITDPTQSSSVDPEDWTSTLSTPVGSLRPGASATVTWRIQPISAGTFTLYAIALAPGAGTVAASNVLEVSVDDQRSLNPDGILPVAIGAPVLVGGLLAVQLRLSRRTRRPSGVG